MDHDVRALGLEDIEKKVVTQRPPTAEEIEAMRFGWRIVKHVKSNAIVFTTSDRTLAIGAGQMSRVDSCRIATWKAEQLAEIALASADTGQPVKPGQARTGRL